ncbi:hypothetical protein CIB84_005290 [Bambusicola thoracicus]|uniref:Uncharacterized protein n=1 Tax=Bambusicola thoracicus TaxID=9083 RepID=A0A2P4T3M0_BAMTH|nr:hypothetical protein CIB84_005290 [Bambusicola thoracicus]
MSSVMSKSETTAMSPEMSGNGSKHFLAQNLWKVWIILQTALLNCSCMSSRWQ